MNLLKSLRSAFAYRRILRSVASIDARLAEQNSYLKRLADHFAPVPPESTEPLRFSIDFASSAELAQVERYAEQVMHDQGRPPTDEEILRYLNDEATIDLRARMEAQDA